MSFIDRRDNPKGKSATNRERFFKRYKKAIKESADKDFGTRKIRDTDKAGDVEIPRGSIAEPSIVYGRGGKREIVLPGNKEYSPGDHIARPQGGGGGGGSGEGGQGDSEDTFRFMLSRDEFMHIFFDDLALPNQLRTELMGATKFRSVQRGFRKDGPIAALSVPRTAREALARRIASRGGLRRKLDEAEREFNLAQDIAERARLAKEIEAMRERLKSLETGADKVDAPQERVAAEVASLTIELRELEQMLYFVNERIVLAQKLVTEELRDAQAAHDNATDPEKQAQLALRIESIKRRLSKVPFIDDNDLRYRNRVLIAEPSFRAVMFCLMDVSASMDEEKKDLAKRFFTLLYLFLSRKYGEGNVDIIFIRHTDDAEEVDEDTFFHDTRSGGTVVCSALELADKIRNERYATGWNVYMAQASDGDAFGADPAKSASFLKDKILQYVRYFAYVEMNRPNDRSTLWAAYENIVHKMFTKTKISQRSEIWPAFRELFRKEGTS